MTSVILNGGLGNWMFQIAFLEYLKDLSKNEIKIYKYGYSPHASTDLMNTIFKNWNQNLISHHSSIIFEETNMIPYDWGNILANTDNIHIIGYFQNYNYVTSFFLEKLTIPTDSLARYPHIKNTVFLHIRGGDYLNHWLLGVNLDNYYLNAIKQFPEGTKFSIFTNDIEYAKTKQFLHDISYEFIQESEIDSLYLMSQCKGGICANSSFSWWGAYLNRTRKLTLPSKWYNDSNFYVQGYYFKEATIIQV